LVPEKHISSSGRLPWRSNWRPTGTRRLKHPDYHCYGIESWIAR